MEVRQQIILATIEAVKEKSLKFTMDDISRQLGISKKTIYTEFETKEELLCEAIDYFFGEVKKSEKKILNDESLDIVEKLKRVIVVLPDSSQSLEFDQLGILKTKYPKVYKKLDKKMTTGWEPTLKLYREAVEQGRLRQCSEVVLKLTIEGAMKEFMSSKELRKEKISYDKALTEMIDMIFRGLIL